MFFFLFLSIPILVHCVELNDVQWHQSSSSRDKRKFSAFVLNANVWWVIFPSSILTDFCYCYHWKTTKKHWTETNKTNSEIKKKSSEEKEAVTRGAWRGSASCCRGAAILTTALPKTQTIFNEVSTNLSNFFPFILFQFPKYKKKAIRRPVITKIQFLCCRCGQNWNLSFRGIFYLCVQHVSVTVRFGFSSSFLNAYHDETKNVKKKQIVGP